MIDDHCQTADQNQDLSPKCVQQALRRRLLAIWLRGDSRKAHSRDLRLVYNLVFVPLRAHNLNKSIRTADKQHKPEETYLALAHYRLLCLAVASARLATLNRPERC